MSLNSLLVILVGMAGYLVFPWAEQNLLVLLELKSPDLSKQQIQHLGPVRAAFQIQRNIDEHMEHVDFKSRAPYNFAIVTEHFSSEANSLKYGDHLQNLKFIKSFKVFPFTSSPIRRHIINLLIRMKSFINQKMPSLVDHFPSLKVNLTPLDEDSDLEHGDLMDELCNDVTIAKPGPEVMINIMKVKEEEAWEKYSLACALSFFPVIESQIWESGTPKSDYWDQVGLVQYASRAGFCRMVMSKEYHQVFREKVDGLEDTHTYLTRQIV